MRALASVAGLAVLYFTIGAVLHSWILPVHVPPEFYPRVGDVFRDDSSGEQVTVLKREGGMSWIRATLAPNGSGPPAHVHTTFDERVVLVDGSATAIVDGMEVRLEAGDVIHFPKRTPHRFYNETSEIAIIEHPLEIQQAFPDRLMLCLSQMWGMTNDAQFLASRSMPIQISLWAPFCDTWDADAPIWLQRTLFLLVAPTARLLGYHPAYACYVPHDL